MPSGRGLILPHFATCCVTAFRRRLALAVGSVHAAFGAFGAIGSTVAVSGGAIRSAVGALGVRHDARRSFTHFNYSIGSVEMLEC